MTNQDVIDRIFKAWQRVPHQKFGLFICNAVPIGSDLSFLFHMENELLVAYCEDYAKRYGELNKL